MWSLNVVDDWQSTIWNLSCTNAKRVIYPGTRTQVFFVLLVLYQKTFSPLVTMLFKLCLATYFKKICFWHDLPQIHSKLYICFPIKKLQFTHTVSMYPWIIYRNCSIPLLLCVSVCSSLVCLCNGLAVLK